VGCDGWQSAAVHNYHCVKQPGAACGWPGNEVATLRWQVVWKAEDTGGKWQVQRLTPSRLCHRHI